VTYYLLERKLRTKKGNTMTAITTSFIPESHAGVSLNDNRSSFEWFELNNELFTVRGKCPRPDNGDTGSGLQSEIAELQSIAKDESSNGQRTRLRRLEYELEKVTDSAWVFRRLSRCCRRGCSTSDASWRVASNSTSPSSLGSSTPTTTDIVSAG